MSPKQQRTYSLVVGAAAVVLASGIGLAQVANMRDCHADGGHYSWGDSSCFVPASIGTPSARAKNTSPSV